MGFNLSSIILFNSSISFSNVIHHIIPPSYLNEFKERFDILENQRYELMDKIKNNHDKKENSINSVKIKLNYTELRFYGVGSNKITLSGKKNSSYGTLKLIFNHNISNYSVSNFRAKSLPNISVETPSYFQNYRNDTRNPRYYHYFNVSGNYSGTSKLEFQICGNYYQTIPLKFIMNVNDEESNHCLYIQLKIPFFIFLFLFFI